LSKSFAVVDVGPRGVSAISAHWAKNGDYAIEGFVRTRTEGFNRGTVENVSKATSAIRETLKELKKQTKRNIKDVYTSISSSSIGINRSSGVLLLSRYGREITELDIKKCIQIASTIKVPIDKEPLHKIVTSFSVDGEREVKNPLALDAVKLLVDVNVLMINNSTVKNVEKCISHAGYLPHGFVFSGLASSYRVLSEEEKEDTVLFLNIDKDMTEMLLFSKGILENCKVLSYGAGDLLLKGNEINEKTCAKLVAVIKSLALWPSVNRAIVIGEGAFSNELLSLFDKNLEVFIRHGNCRVKPLEEIPHQNEEYICTLGMLDYLQADRNQNKPDQNVILRSFRGLTAFLDKYF